MLAEKAISRMLRDITKADSCLEGGRCNIFYRQYPELLIPKDSITIKFHFDKKLGNQRISTKD